MGIKMRYVVDEERMRRIDRFTIQNIGIPALVLMEKSAMAVAEGVIKAEDETGRQLVNKKDRILAVCGTGNNGGDGIAACRLLREKGYLADILILGDEKRASEQTRQQLQIARNLDVPVLNNTKLKEYNVIIDAIFGIGLDKPVAGIFEAVIKEMNQEENLVFSVDVPSGIHSGSGKVMHEAVRADYTITFGLMKQGLLLYPGCEYAGKVTVADIGFPPKAVEAVQPEVFYYEPEDFLKLPKRMKYSNKGTFGRVLIIAGSRNMCGACFLSGKAAYRTGAGLVKVLTVEDNRNIMQTLLPEAVSTTYNPADFKNKLEIDRIIKEMAWATAIVIGPGMGINGASEKLLDIVLENAKVPVVVDADALNILAARCSLCEEETEERLSSLTLSNNMILTPHLMEMARLLDKDVEEIRRNIMDTAARTAGNQGCTVVLKDARTIVSDGKQSYINISGNNGMATGGSGDVLTGIIVALLAQGMDHFEAAALGVYLHGLAADYAAKKGSCYSLMAGDIIEALSYVLP